VVLGVDDPRLAALADRSEQQGKKVWRVSTRDQRADVCVEDADGLVRVWVHGEKLAELSVDARPVNLGCALAVALELGAGADTLIERLPTLPAAPHRLEPAPTSSGRCLVLDDTYNSNPAGASVALEALLRMAPVGGRRVVVTPGMVELGHRQAEENARFGAEAARVSSGLVFVGRTNRRALVRGARSAGDAAVASRPSLVLVDTRDQAVAWVRDHLGEGDVVLFENDLPDHYP